MNIFINLSQSINQICAKIVLIAWRRFDFSIARSLLVPVLPLQIHLLVHMFNMILVVALLAERFPANLTCEWSQIVMNQQVVVNIGPFWKPLATKYATKLVT